MLLRTPRRQAMKLFPFVGLAFIWGCGPARDVTQPVGLSSARAVDPFLGQELASILTSYTTGLLRGDRDAVLTSLSTERLARIDSAGGVERVMEEQAGQVRRGLGPDGRLDQGFEATAVETFESGRVIAVDLSLNDRPLPKRVYFVREQGQYKLNLRPPQTSAEGTSHPEGTTTQGLAQSYEVVYKIHNAFTAQRSYKVRQFSGTGFSNEKTLSASSFADESVFADNCANIFLDGTQFIGKDALFWGNPVMCAYQWFATDFANSTSDIWGCLQTCS